MRGKPHVVPTPVLTLGLDSFEGTIPSIPFLHCGLRALSHRHDLRLKGFQTMLSYRMPLSTRLGFTASDIKVVAHGTWHATHPLFGGVAGQGRAQFHERLARNR